jgi:hypothetical protein
MSIATIPPIAGNQLVMRIVANREKTPRDVYCCGACYNAAIPGDKMLAKHFVLETAPTLFTFSESFHRSHPVYSQCAICDRYIFRIISEVDIITRIETAIKSGESNSSLHVALKAHPSWLFHGPTTRFKSHLADVSKDTRIDVDTILSHSHVVQGIQSLETVRRKIKSYCRSDEQKSDAAHTWANEHGLWELDSDAIDPMLGDDVCDLRA